jgi:hypothetical protein
MLIKVVDENLQWIPSKKEKERGKGKVRNVKLKDATFCLI